MKKAFIAISATALMMVGMSISAGAQTYYVDNVKAGKQPDGSLENPFGTIQAAVDAAGAGDEVIVAPGIYYESVTITNGGTPEKPLTLRAAETGENKTIITCANKSIREGSTKWICEDPKIDLYYIPYTRNVGSLLFNGAKMFAYKSLEELKTFRAWADGVEKSNDTMDGFFHGYYYDPNAKRLYVRIGKGDKYGSTDPNQNVMAVGGPYYDSVMRNGVKESAYRRSGISTDSYCVGIVTENSANVIVSGFTLEAPGWAGVFCRAHDVVIDNCWFKGCFSGIAGGRYSAYDQWTSENVTMRNCDWNLWPTFDDGVEAQKRETSKYPWRWWCVKTTSWCVFDYEAGGVLTQVGHNWTLKDSKISQCLDGLSSGCLDGYYVYDKKYNTNWILGECDGLEISGCEFLDILDNAVETENHGRNINIHDCYFGNALESISWQPLDGEPWPTNIFVHHNMFKADDWFIQIVYRYIKDASHWLKIGAATSNWNRPAMREKGDTLIGETPIFPMVLADKGLWIYNNSVYWPDGYTASRPGGFGGVDQVDTNMYMLNNIFYGRAQPDNRPFRAYIAAGDFIGGLSRWWLWRNNMFIQSNPDVVDISAQSTGGTEFTSFEAAGVEWDGEIMKLRPGSPGIGGGEQVWFEERDTTDIGAIPRGGEWKIYPGPYITGDVNRDGTVDIADVMEVSRKIGQDGYDNKTDVNLDGITDETDLKTVSDLAARQ